MLISEDLKYELKFLESHGKQLDWSELICPDCQTEVTIVAINDIGVPDYEMICCPVCGADIQQIRADIGYRLATIEEPGKEPRFGE